MLQDHVIIAGFGVPGRAAAEQLERRGRSCVIVERNGETVERCRRSGRRMVAGDATLPQTLREAGAEHARLIVIALPDDAAAIETTRQARLLNPGAHIITRCHFTSRGIEARAAGADNVVVAEQVVAAELVRLLAADPQPSGSLHPTA